MKMSKFKIVFIILLIATIAWGIAFYYTLQGYREYCEWVARARDFEPHGICGMVEAILLFQAGFYC